MACHMLSWPVFNKDLDEEYGEVRAHCLFYIVFTVQVNLHIFNNIIVRFSGERTTTTSSQPPTVVQVYKSIPSEEWHNLVMSAGCQHDAVMGHETTYHVFFTLRLPVPILLLVEILDAQPSKASSWLAHLGVNLCWNYEWCHIYLFIYEAV